MEPFRFRAGRTPLLVSMPHTGTHVPEGLAERMTKEALQLPDTDWHVDRLYDGLLPDATTVRATFHRYVIDANRGPDDASLYPGQNTTGLVPLTDFDGRPIWDDGPGPDEVAARTDRFHAPYHAALAAEVARVKARHGVAILYDCHSIRSRIPFLFEGVLPDFNIGTNDGATCDPRIEEATRALCAATGRPTVTNGRFKGGWTTRHYGRPEAGVHAVQMELAQSTHLAAEEPPFAYDEGKAAALRETLRDILAALAALAPSLRRPA